MGYASRVVCAALYTTPSTLRSFALLPETWIASSRSQPANQVGFMAAIPAPSVTDRRAVQSAKALSPMLVTLSGISTVLICSPLPAKACAAMAVTGSPWMLSGITIS